jgi:ribosomal-protein-alanine N-acetyltransferase
VARVQCETEPAPVRHVIETARARLVSFDVDFLRASLAGERARAEASIGMALPASWPDLPDVLRLRLTQLEAEPALAPWLTRALELKSERRLVGIVGFHGPPGGDWLREFAERGLEFGYSVLAGYRRRGLAFEACQALIAWAVSEHAAREFVLSMSPHNAPSAALARKLGFARVGEWHHAARGLEDVYRLTLPPPAGGAA